jgi:hypothetical protein
MRDLFSLFDNEVNRLFNNFNGFFNVDLMERVDEKGDRYHYKNGMLHNDSGPAVIHKDGTKEYWLEGKRVKESDVIKIEPKKKVTIDVTEKERQKIRDILGREI